MSGIASTAFCVVGLAAFKGGTDSRFLVVLDIAISTTLISYLWIFPAALKLRFTHGHVYRPYRHPWGMAGIWISTILTTFWIALGSFEAVFPDVLEKVFGVGYGFTATWGVSRGTFEALTLGTLGVITAFALVGYWFGREVRAETIEVPIEAGVATVS
jgi:amino acid transporter